MMELTIYQIPGLHNCILQNYFMPYYINFDYHKKKLETIQINLVKYNHSKAFHKVNYYVLINS